ncbi:hypothetical protein C8Q76DRAFT_613974 [Earliella scabrosa]|nr:hypothetical protein C8Q76DRAFT_613974 [Earliella scabrosa]
MKCRRQPCTADCIISFRLPEIISSSDHVYFHLRKGILAETSAVFEEMFGAPNPSGHAVDNGSVLLTQSSRTLDKLFRLYYPVRDPDIPTLKDALCVFAAAEKYMVPYAVKRMPEVMLTFADREPLPMWATFYSLGMSSEALQAAHQTILGRSVHEEAYPGDGVCGCCRI